MAETSAIARVTALPGLCRWLQRFMTRFGVDLAAGGSEGRKMCAALHRAGDHRVTRALTDKRGGNRREDLLARFGRGLVKSWQAVACTGA